MAHSVQKQWLSYLKKLTIGIVGLMAFITVNAQPPLAGYTGLGVYNGHYYYISEDIYFGKDISVAVTDARAKILAIEPARPANHVYAAAILNQGENDFIQNAIVAYNSSKYGGNGKSTFENWGDPRNPWIGLTDVGSEGNFGWSNGQPICEDYRNWNEGEPNNYTGPVSNGEDYTQMLIMNPYLLNGNPNHDPLGKWNDWFNEVIISDNNKPTKLPVIIEVGPADCAPLNVSLTATTNVSCFGEDNGTATFNISTGLAPFTYTLDDGEESVPFNTTTFTIEDLEAGNHSIVVTDANGNTKTVNFFISQPASPLDAQSSLLVDVKCNGGNTGSVTIIANGGTAPYTGTGTFGNLTAGEHSFIVRDANGCQDDVTVIIGEPEKLMLDADDPIAACNGNNGAITITATGGTPPYTGTGVKTGLAPGSHTFVVTDANGCEESITVVIDGTEGSGFNVMPETFPNQFNTNFYKSLSNKTFVGSSGTWTVNSNSYATMVVTRPYYSPSSSYALKIVNFKTWNCGSGWAKAVSPKLNLTGPCCPDGVKLNFTLWTYNVVSGDSKAKLEIDFSSDNGSSWTEVWSKTSAQLFSAYGDNGKVGINIPIPVGYHTANFRYRIRGEMASNDYNNFYLFIDDINITSPASCGPNAPTGAIGNLVWNDVNGNGKQDPGEPGLGNVTVKLTLPNSTTQTKTTNAAGAYSFTGLAAGNYTVTFTTPSGFNPAPANAGADDGLDSDPVSGNVAVVLAAGQVNNTIDAGFKAITCTNTTNHKETFPNKFNSWFMRSLYNKTFTGSSGTWTVSSNAYATMTVTTPYYSPSTSYALKVVNFKTQNCGAGWTRAVSPKVDLSDPCCPSELKLNFTLWTYKVVANDTKAKLEIDFSSNNGATWNEVWSKTSSQLKYSYGAYGKTYISISIPLAYQNSNFRYRIRGEMASNDRNNFYVFIDDIKIGSPANCNTTQPIANGRTMGSDKEDIGAGSETMGAKKPVEMVDELVTDFKVNVFPNPTNAEFELKMSSKETAPVSVRVTDMLGRIVKTLRISANQSVRFGAEFRSGSYVVEITQGERKEIVKLIKL